MSIDLEKLKRELEQISPWPWTMTQNVGWGAAIWDSGKNILFRVERNSLDASKTSEDCPMPLWKKDTSFARKSPEIIAALIEEAEQANELLEDRWNESADRDMPLLREIEELREKLHQAEKRIKQLRQLSGKPEVTCKRTKEAT